MRGVFRRPYYAVLAGSFGITLGTFVGAMNVRGGHPRYLMVAAILLISGIGLAGIFPGDRDLNERDTRTWQRMAPYLLFGPIAVLFGELILPLPGAIGALVIGFVFAAFIAGHAWFMTRGRPMTDAILEEEIAKSGMTPALVLMSARPAFWGKSARVATLVIGGGMAALITLGMVFPRDYQEPKRPARWLELPVHYCTDTTLDGYIDDDVFNESAALAFQRWGVAAVHDGACPSLVERDDGVSAIGWRPMRGDHTGVTFRIASCRYFCSGDEAHSIGEADVYLKPFTEDDYADRDCFDALMLHEVGHFLGLNHNDGYGVLGDGGYCSSEFSSEDLASLFERYGAAADPQYATLTGSH